MATFNKFNQFTADLLAGKHNFSSHIFKIMLTNVAPTAANAVKADLTEIASGSGYSGGGTVTTITATTSGGIAKIAGTDVTFTSTGSIGPFRYAVLYNETSSGQPLVAWWDYGSSTTLLVNEIMTVDFSASNGIFTVT